MNRSFEISVGIIAAEKIRFIFNGQYQIVGNKCGATSETINYDTDGIQSVEVSPSGHILWQDCEYDSIICKQLSKDSTFTLCDVVIGVDFHWQRLESQSFEGALKFVIETSPDGSKLVRAINIVNLERYLVSVISSEMNCDSPSELLKAHAVISRSWLVTQILSKDKKAENNNGLSDADLDSLSSEKSIVRWFDREDHDLFDVCADDHCQRYQGITKASNPAAESAVNSTAGQVLIDSCGNICDTRFSKCCGGATELFENCWENRHFDYLTPVSDTVPPIPIDDLATEEGAAEWILNPPKSPFCSTHDSGILRLVLNDYDQTTTDFYRWKVTYTQRELSELVSRRSGIDFGRIKALIPVKRGPSARLVLLKIVGENQTVVVGKELMIRRWLSESHLYSSAFVVESIGKDSDGFPEKFILHGAGWGHGVGLCQIGAAVMSARGYCYQDILSHYFPGSLLTDNLLPSMGQ